MWVGLEVRRAAQQALGDFARGWLLERLALVCGGPFGVAHEGFVEEADTALAFVQRFTAAREAGSNLASEPTEKKLAATW